jgi:hypothetical protein
MSDTPRTDTVEQEDMFEHACQLERELAEKDKEIAELKQQVHEITERATREFIKDSFANCPVDMCPDDRSDSDFCEKCYKHWLTTGNTKQQNRKDR